MASMATISSWLTQLEQGKYVTQFKSRFGDLEQLSLACYAGEMGVASVLDDCGVEDQHDRGVLATALATLLAVNDGRRSIRGAPSHPSRHFRPRSPKLRPQWNSCVHPEEGQQMAVWEKLPNESGPMPWEEGFIGLAPMTVPPVHHRPAPTPAPPQDRAPPRRRPRPRFSGVEVPPATPPSSSQQNMRPHGRASPPRPSSARAASHTAPILPMPTPLGTRLTALRTRCSWLEHHLETATVAGVRAASDLTALRGKHAEASSQLTELQGEHAELRSLYDDVTQKLGGSSGKLNISRLQGASASSRLEKANERLKAVEKANAQEMAALRAELAEARAALAVKVSEADRSSAETTRLNATIIALQSEHEAAMARTLADANESAAADMTAALAAAAAAAAADKEAALAAAAEDQAAALEAAQEAAEAYLSEALASVQPETEAAMGAALHGAAKVAAETAVAEALAAADVGALPEDSNEEKTITTARAAPASPAATRYGIKVGLGAQGSGVRVRILRAAAPATITTDTVEAASNDDAIDHAVEQASNDDAIDHAVDHAFNDDAIGHAVEQASNDDAIDHAVEQASNDDAIKHAFNDDAIDHAVKPASNDDAIDHAVEHAAILCVASESREWLYFDATEAVQGPFADWEFLKWCHRGYLPTELMVRTAGGPASSEYQPLSVHIGPGGLLEAPLLELAATLAAHEGFASEGAGAEGPPSEEFRQGGVQAEVTITPSGVAIVVLKPVLLGSPPIAPTPLGGVVDTAFMAPGHGMLEDGDRVRRRSDYRRQASVGDEAMREAASATAIYDNDAMPAVAEPPPNSVRRGSASAAIQLGSDGLVRVSLAPQLVPV